MVASFFGWSSLTFLFCPRGAARPKNTSLLTPKAAVGRSGCNSDSSIINHINIGGGSDVDPGAPAAGGGEGGDARAGVAGALGEVTTSGRLAGRPKGVNDQ